MMDDTEQPPVTTASDSGATADTTDDTPPIARGAVRYHTTPTIRPVLVRLGCVMGGGLIAIGLLWAVPELVGGDAIARPLMVAIAGLVGLIALRDVLKIAVLSRTHYTIRDDVLQREYDLLYRTKSRELPVGQLRAHELSQTPVQSFLGVGTVRLLTAGPTHSLGFLAFEHLEKPEYVREEIRLLVTTNHYE